ncbi:hypothetical protein N7541_002386 [Penicillium brevicompactum]|uniref:Serine hydrolase domain-containing protein n=1 Tax=Penicillium brevicompactum TaxID=5074 RepID=A0A9W9UXX9_PENBR|nr:hypothetical protein N7541_002386 [Penicillium brevicompactum]
MSPRRVQFYHSPFTNSFTSGGDISFHYVQGTIDMAVPPEFEGFFGPPPHYSFVQADGREGMVMNMRDFPKRNTPEEAVKDALKISGDPTYSCVKEVMERLIGVLDSEGDIEGVIGYSEGAQVAASLLMEEKRRADLGRTPRIKCALLFHGWPPIDPVSGKMVVIDDFETEPITIPTCHVIGAIDPFLDGSMALYNMCDPDTADLFDHGGGHVLPRAKHYCDELSAVVHEMINSVS